MTECTRCRRQYQDGVRFCPVDGFAAVPMTDPYLGRQLLGQFQLLAACGRGATGTVYRAQQTAMDRLVAVKVLRADLLQDPTVVKRFVREARAGARLCHPNIATVHLVGQTDEGVPYIVMEYIEGTPLSSLCGEEAPLGAARILHIAEQIASALAEAHDKNIVHRDLKPENILLTERRGDRDIVKVVDFGIAKIVADHLNGDSQISRIGTIFGTPHYIAPEQASGSEVDARADLYSLGCILFQMATGRVPFEGTSGIQVLLRHLRDPVPNPRAQNPHLPEPLAQLIGALLAKSRDERPQSAEAVLVVVRDLKEQLRNLPQVPVLGTAETLMGLGGTPRQGRTGEGVRSWSGAGRGPVHVGAPELASVEVAGPLASGAHVASAGPLASGAHVASAGPLASGAHVASAGPLANGAHTAAAGPLASGAHAAAAGPLANGAHTAAAGPLASGAHTATAASGASPLAEAAGRPVVPAIATVVTAQAVAEAPPLDAWSAQAPRYDDIDEELSTALPWWRRRAVALLSGAAVVGLLLGGLWAWRARVHLAGPATPPGVAATNTPDGVARTPGLPSTAPSRSLVKDSATRRSAVPKPIAPARTRTGRGDSIDDNLPETRFPANGPSAQVLPSATGEAAPANPPPASPGVPARVEPLAPVRPTTAKSPPPVIVPAPGAPAGDAPAAAPAAAPATAVAPSAPPVIAQPPVAQPEPRQPPPPPPPEEKEDNSRDPYHMLK